MNSTDFLNAGDEHSAQRDGDSQAAPQRSKTKLGERIASSLSEYIADENLQVGHPIGSEAELAERFRTSRWTMREALSMLRGEGIIEIRRGRLGGYFVAQSGKTPFSGAMRAYFEFLDVSVEEIIGARRILGELVLRLAMKRVTLQDIPALRSPADPHQALFSATGNLVAQKLIRSARRFEKIALLRSTLDEADYKRSIAEIEALRMQELEAVIAYDFEGAWAVESIILERSEDMLRRIFASAQPQTEAAFVSRIASMFGGKGISKPEILAHLLGADVVARGWPVGEHLGSEPELLTRYGVGRSVFREAVRPLEQTGLVVMQTGRKSGLKIGGPSIERLISLSLEQFARMRAPEADYARTLESLFMGAAALAAGRKDSIAPTDDREPGTFINSVANACGNRVISTMIRILVARWPTVTMDATGAISASSDVDDMRRALVTAVQQGDVALARRAAFLLLRKLTHGKDSAKEIS